MLDPMTSESFHPCHPSVNRINELSFSGVMWRAAIPWSEAQGLQMLIIEAALWLLLSHNFKHNITHP